jgi:type VI secretion system protein ImpK
MKPRKKPLRARREQEAPAESAHNPRLGEITDDVFDAVLQLRRLEEGEMPAPENLHRRLRSMIDVLQQNAAERGYSREDGEDIQYALAAFVDETAINSCESIRDFWQANMLQMEYFEENNAGEGFFDRLEKIRKNRDRADVLLVYFFCLTLGFKGKYRVRGADSELLEMIESVKEALNRGGLREPEALSPHSERSDQAAKEERRRISIVLVPVVAAILSLVAYLLFGRIQPEIDRTIETMDTIIAGSSR